jgi:hypothetical protein
MLQSWNLPSVCFMNMATVAGEPDLAAVRLYDRRGGLRRLDRHVPGGEAPQVLAWMRERYSDDDGFRSFQGSTATAEHLRRVVDAGYPVWFGSHLYHHWDIRLIDADVYAAALGADRDALAPYPNSIPAFATPHGYAGRDDDFTTLVPPRAGFKVIFTATGGQNRRADSYVLDRLGLPTTPSTHRDWWYSTHRGRLFGPIIE